MQAAMIECPQATTMVHGLTREALVIWLTEYPKGRWALRVLEQVLTSHGAAYRSPEQEFISKVCNCLELAAMKRSLSQEEIYLLQAAVDLKS